MKYRYNYVVDGVKSTLPSFIRLEAETVDQAHIQVIEYIKQKWPNKGFSIYVENNVMIRVEAEGNYNFYNMTSFII